MRYQIELAETEDFEILHANSDIEIINEAEKIQGGYLNIFEVNSDYEIIRQVM